MDSIETLMLEHRQIERALTALEGYAAAMRAGAETDRDELGRFARFFAEYADRLHHGKEEDLLFAAMVEAGFPRESGPLYVMLHDHDTGRALVRQLREIASGSGPLSTGERQAAAAAAVEFAGMLRAHINKEDRVLYPMAEAHLPELAMAQLQQEFAAAEARQGADAERLCALIEPLIAAWGEGRRAHAAHAGERGRFDHEPEGGGCCGCGG